MQKLYEVAEKEGLTIEEFAPLPEGFYGLYYNEENHFPVASLSREIYGQTILERSVLAEEIGHYLTTSDHCLPKFFKNYTHRLSVSRQEYKAARRGGQLLISSIALLGAITTGLEEVWELAEHFGVTEDLMGIRLHSWMVSGR